MTRDATYDIGRRGLLATLAAAGLMPLTARAQMQGQDSAPATGSSAAAIIGGPSEILISYRCDSANRPAFRRYLANEMMARLKALQARGTLKSYQILFNPFVSETWDAMVLLSFHTYADTQAWKIVERSMPGGLDAAGLKLGHPIQTYNCDLEWQGWAADPGPEHQRVAYAIPYSYNALGQYKTYVDAYVIPQVKGWIDDGALSGYRFYLNRYQTGDPWDCLFIYDYRNLEQFGRRDEVVAKVRATLQSNAEWVHLNEIKATIRSESENTIADIL